MRLLPHNNGDFDEQTHDTYDRHVAEEVFLPEHVAPYRCGDLLRGSRSVVSRTHRRRLHPQPSGSSDVLPVHVSDLAPLDSSGRGGAISLEEI